MAESGRIAARRLRGTFRRIVAGAGFRNVSPTVITMSATRMSQGRAPAISHCPPAFVAGLDATEDTTIDIVND
jgi:hypothetical protein